MRRSRLGSPECGSVITGGKNPKPDVHIVSVIAGSNEESTIDIGSVGSLGFYPYRGCRPAAVLLPWQVAVIWLKLRRSRVVRAARRDQRAYRSGITIRIRRRWRAPSTKGQVLALPARGGGSSRATSSSVLSMAAASSRSSNSRNAISRCFPTNIQGFRDTGMPTMRSIFLQRSAQLDYVHTLEPVPACSAVGRWRCRVMVTQHRVTRVLLDESDRAGSLRQDKGVFRLSPAARQSDWMPVGYGVDNERWQHRVNLSFGSVDSNDSLYGWADAVLPGAALERSGDLGICHLRGAELNYVWSTG